MLHSLLICFLNSLLSSHPEETEPLQDLDTISPELNTLLEKVNIGDIESQTFMCMSSFAKEELESFQKEQPNFALIQKKYLRFGSKLGSGASAVVHKGAFAQPPSSVLVVAIKVFFSFDIKEFSEECAIFA